MSASDPDGDPLTYTWSCKEDPTIDSITENEFTWTPPSPGTYNIEVTVSDGINQPVKYQMQIVVGTGQVPPQANISAPSSAYTGEEIAFSGAGSMDPDGVIITYEWDFGDGENGVGQDVTHTYTSPGTYNVKLTVTDNSGLTGTAVETISISGPPSPPYPVSEYFIPSGWMGDYGDIEYDEACSNNPHSGTTCIRITYSPSGSNEWAGIYWQYPEGNWGDQPGWNLHGATKLTFWARGDTGGEKAEFKVGGIKTAGKPYSDSIYPAVSTGVLSLSTSWQQYTIDLSGKDMSNVIGGFCWVTNKTGNPDGATIYIDDMVYEE